MAQGVPETSDGGKEPLRSRWLLARVLVLAALVMLTDIWFRRHLGWPMWEKLSGGAVFVAVAAAALQTTLGEERFKRNLKSTAQWFLQTDVLVCFAFVLLAGGSFFSSVEVSDSAAEGGIPVVLSGGGWDPGEKELEDSDSVVRFFRPVTPFGRPYVLEARGYQRHAFDLYPWVGARIRLSSMLEVAPTILLRVPQGKHGLLPNGKVELCLLEDQRCVPIGEIETEEGRGAVFFGRVRPIPARLLTIWQAQLREHESTVRDSSGSIQPAAVEAAFSRGFLKWAEEPLQATPLRTIREGMVLEARFLARDGNVHARRRFTVTGEVLQDKLLEKVSQ